MLQQIQNLSSDNTMHDYQTCPLLEFACNAESWVEHCLELNFRYVDYQALVQLSYSSCICWRSVRATRAKRYLSVEN